VKNVSARWVPRMLSEVHAKWSGLVDKSNVLRLFNENPNGFISGFLTVNETFTTSIMKTKFSVRPGNTPLLHLERVALRRRLAKLWRLYSGIDYNGSAIRRTYYADLIGKVRAALKEKRRGKLRRGVLFHQDNARSHTSSEALAAIWSAGFKLLVYPPLVS